MRSSTAKRVVSFLFLVAFLLLRVGGVQAMSHDHDDEHEEHCELCELMALAEERTPIQSGPAEVEIKAQTVVPYPSEIPFTYETPQFQISEPSYVYNKPPPTSGE